MRAKTAVLGLIVVGAGLLWADGEWPNWRGPQGDGTAGEADPPAQVGPERNLAWKLALSGRGCSTPMVWGDLIVLTAEMDGEDGVVAVDRKGTEKWRAKLGKGSEFKHQSAGSGCNPSAVCDGKHIFVYFRSGTLAGLDMQGAVLWKKNLQTEYAEDGLKWDLGTSPVLAGGHVVVAMMHNNSPSFLLAFDKKDGGEVWKTARDYDAPAEANDSYTTPIVTEVEGVETLVTWGGDQLTGHDAKTGELLWEHGDFNPDRRGNWRTIASPVVTEGIALVPFGRGDFVAGVKLGGSGDTTRTHRLWTREGLGSDSATPLAFGGRFVVLQDSGPRRGTVTMLKASTGETLESIVLPRGAAIYYSSPMLAKDKLYLGRSDGTLFCATLSKEELSEPVVSELGEPLVATPVAAGKQLLVRTHEHLWCFE